MKPSETRIVSVHMMKEREKMADLAGLSYYQMMENAGTKAFEVIQNEFESISSILIVCGKGNNGGDGLVIARLAALKGINVEIIFPEGEPVTTDAITNLNKLPKSVKILLYSVPESSPDIIIDALYGTGFHGGLRESGKNACKFMNEFEKPVVSLDIPSGAVADTGENAENAVRAYMTIVFDSLKFIHTKENNICGKIVLVDIGINDILKDK